MNIDFRKGIGIYISGEEVIEVGNALEGITSIIFSGGTIRKGDYLNINIINEDVSFMPLLVKEILKEDEGYLLLYEDNSKNIFWGKVINSGELIVMN